MTTLAAIVDGLFILEKFPGKGGWVYAALPTVLADKTKPFGWRTVKGFIDDYPINQYKLMPLGNGQLFLPVKKEIRTKIGKDAGDTVRVLLYADNSPLEIPNEIITCFEFEPKTSWETFKALSQTEQKAYLDWIYSAKTQNTKTNRILQMMQKLENGLKYHDKF